MDCSARKEDVDSSSESPAVTDIEDLLMSEFKEVNFALLFSLSFIFVTQK